MRLGCTHIRKCSGSIFTLILLHIIMGRQCGVMIDGHSWILAAMQCVGVKRTCGIPNKGANALGSLNSTACSSTDLVSPVHEHLWSVYNIMCRCFMVL